MVSGGFGVVYLDVSHKFRFEDMSAYLTTVSSNFSLHFA